MGATLLNRLIWTRRTRLPFAIKEGLRPLDWLFTGCQSGKFGKFVELDFKMLNWHFISLNSSLAIWKI
nr:hypothetical protein CFP56_55354 [Quercus suber]